jgi:dipeptidyl aminopeptidase/acylaminoacyl peptidase
MLTSSFIGCRVPIIVLLPLLWTVSGFASNQRSDPLPIEAVVAFNSHNWVVGIDLSPDGSWVSRTYSVGGDTVVSASPFFTITGGTTAFGNSRSETTLTNVATGEVVVLGKAATSTWGAVWSSDGARVAYYSDEGAEVGVWIWEKSTHQSWRFPGVTARPHHVTHLIRWLADNQRIVCRILPEGVTVAEANALGGSAQSARSELQLKSGRDGLAVRVLRAPAAVEQRQAHEDDAGVDLSWEIGDLAILDLGRRTVQRIASHPAIWTYAVSPDQRTIAFSVLDKIEPTTNQNLYDVFLYSILTQEARVLLHGVSLRSSLWSWSPSSQQIAFFANGTGTATDLLVADASTGAQVVLGGSGRPVYDVNELSVPIWASDSASLFVVGRGKLWRVPTSGAVAISLGSDADVQLASIVTPSGSATIWRDRRRNAWLTGTVRDGRQGLFSVDLENGAMKPAFLKQESILDGANLHASDKAQAIFFVSDAQDHQADISVYTPFGGAPCRVSALNAAVSAYTMGRAKIVSWRGRGGELLRGALLLPPRYESGRRLPLVVWVYGGALGSEAVNEYGLASSSPEFNMQVLVTRGYAVLYPDTPVRTGSTSHDLAETVLPGVDAVIAQGYADSDRLAVMGTSYGSYSTFALITQTTRFKAAIVSAVTHQDFLTGYLTLGPQGELPEIGFYESTRASQGNIGGTPWAYRDRYIDNSPIWSFDKIETPVLMAHGTADFIPLQAPDAVFAALKRLGKRVEYVTYKDEGHVMERKENVIDFWKRRLDFLAENLDLRTDRSGRIIFQGDRAVSLHAH